MSDCVIVALDVANRSELDRLLGHFTGLHPYVKVGMELFYQQGPELVRDLKAEGFPVFLDLKLHDIPTTVHKAMRGLARLGVDMINVHAAGGKAMMRAAMRGLAEGVPLGRKPPLCLAVTQLTSTDQAMLESELLIDDALEKVVTSYAHNAYECGLDGVVCSPWEARAIKRETNKTFVTVTPGIRLASDTADDQKRIATPAAARKLGSDFIVVGRSITNAPDPRAAYESILKEWSETDDKS